MCWTVSPEIVGSNSCPDIRMPCDFCCIGTPYSEHNKKMKMKDSLLVGDKREDCRLNAIHGWSTEVKKWKPLHAPCG